MSHGLQTSAKGLLSVTMAMVLAIGLLAVPHALAQIRDIEVEERSQPEEPADLDARDREDLKKIIAYLNQFRSMRARFVQVTSRGGYAEGDLAMLRPGRMRFDYDSPEPTLLVADGLNFVVYDRELEQATMIPLRSTPLWFLLRREVTLDEGVEVRSLERHDDNLSVTLAQDGAEERGLLTLTFSTDPVELTQWEVIDATGLVTRVALLEPRYDPDPPPNPREFSVQDLPGIAPPGLQHNR